MKKSDVAARVAAKCSLSRGAADSVVTAILSSIEDALTRGESVSIAGFGTFSVKSRPARQGRNPRSGEAISIAASNVPSFKAGKGLRDALG